MVELERAESAGLESDPVVKIGAGGVGVGRHGTAVE